MPALAFAAINIVESNFVTPWIIGRRLELSPLAVFLSVMLLGWLWGIAGAFIAGPFLVALRSAARRSMSLRIWTRFLDRGRDEPPSLRRLLEIRRKPRARPRPGTDPKRVIDPKKILIGARGLLLNPRTVI